MAVLFNPTSEVIKCQHGGMYTLFRPGEKKEIWDNYAAEHMLNRWGKDGLVKLNFGPKEAQEFDDFEEFEHAQKILGLTNYLESLEERVERFSLYDEACDTKKSTVRRQVGNQANGVKKQLDKVKNDLLKLEAINPKKTPLEKAALLRKKAKELEEQAQAELKKVEKEKHGDHASKSN